MFYDFAVTVPAGTAAASPYEKLLKLTRGVIHRVEVEFPAGCRSYVFLVLMLGGHQLYPTNPDEQFNTDDYIIPIEDHFPLVAAPYQLKAVAWSPDADYSHTVTVRIGVRRWDIISLLQAIAQMFALLLEKFGIKPPSIEGGVEYITLYEGEGKVPEEEEVPLPPEEELPPPEEELPPPEELPPLEELPVCAIGETTCQGYDLYECREVEGKAGWALAEANSTRCGYIPPRRGTIEEAQWEIDQKPQLSSNVVGMLETFLDNLSEAQRDTLETWTGWRLLPDEMGARDLADWKSSYYTSTPYFTYMIRYPKAVMTPGEYYRKMSDYKIALGL